MAIPEETVGIGLYGTGLLYTDERRLPYRPQSGLHVAFLPLDTLELSLYAYGGTMSLVPLIKTHAAGLRRRRGQVYPITEQICVILGTQTFLMRSAQTKTKRKKP
jgi:hypothetical protein